MGSRCGEIDFIPGLLVIWAAHSPVLTRNFRQHYWVSLLYVVEDVDWSIVPQINSLILAPWWLISIDKVGIAQTRECAQSGNCWTAMFKRNLYTFSYEQCMHRCASSVLHCFFYTIRRTSVSGSRYMLFHLSISSSNRSILFYKRK